MTIAQTETQRIGTLAINDAMSKKILEDLGFEDLVQIERDNNGNVSFIQFNHVTYNRVMVETVKRVQSYLNAIEHGNVRDVTLPTEVNVEQQGATFSEDGIIHMIPLGQATNNALLAHLGPKIPVRLSAIGDVKADFGQDVISTGINNTVINLTIEIEVDVRVVIPFATDEEVIKTSIPAANVFIAGQVPEFYSRGGSGFGAGIIQTPRENEASGGEVETAEIEIVGSDN